MKVIDLKALMGVGIAITSLYSCRNDGAETVSTMDELKTVSFSEAETKVISTTKTGELRYNPSNNATEFEYLKEIQKPIILEPMSFMGVRNTEIVFPGSILRGSSFVEGNYDPIVSKTPFKDITLSVSLRGNYTVKSSAKPVLSEVRNTINTLVAKNKSEIDYSFVPAYVSYQSNIVNTLSSFNKSFNLHSKADVLGGLVSAKFSYRDEYNSSNSKKYIMVKLHQNFYNVSVDPKHYTDWFEGNPNVSDFGSYEPVYVSSVDYGRAAYLLIETNKSEEESKRMVSAAVNVAFKAVSAEADYAYSRNFKKLFEESKIKVLIVGGPAKLAGEVDSYDKFIEFIKTPTIEDLIASAAPISYKIRRLRDNTEVEVKSTIVEKELEYKKD